MKLHWSPLSPYTRKVMIVAHERGLTDRIEIVPKEHGKTTPELLHSNPLGKIPTLVLDDGTPLIDSRVIAEYLDGMGDGEPLFPKDPERRFQALGWMGLSEGLTDILIQWRGERARPAEFQSPPHLASFEARRDRAFARLNEIAPELERTPFAIGHIAAGIVPNYSEVRFPEYDWRNLHPALARWHETVRERPSFQATMPKMDA